MSLRQSMLLVAAVLCLLGCRSPDPSTTSTAQLQSPSTKLEAGKPTQGKDWQVPDVGMEFVWVKALNCWVGKYEVTNGEYRKKDPRHDSKRYQHYENPSPSVKHSLNGDRQPVVHVYYSDARDYARWLTEKEHKAGRLPKGMKYRLPTEKEWQVLAQCGDDREYPWGNDWPPKYGNYHGKSGAGYWKKIDGYDDGFAVTCPVEKSGKNEWGLYGVGGNVKEACSKELSGEFGAWRGGAWGFSDRNLMRCSFRKDIGARHRNRFYGFRLLLSR